MKNTPLGKAFQEKPFQNKAFQEKRFNNSVSRALFQRSAFLANQAHFRRFC